MAWVEKGHNDHLVSTPCYVQGRQPADQAAQSHIQPGLECLQGWGIHSLLGQPVPVPHHPLGEKLPPNIQPKPPLSQFKTIPPCPIYPPVHFGAGEGRPSSCSISWGESTCMALLQAEKSCDPQAVACRDLPNCLCGEKQNSFKLWM